MPGNIAGYTQIDKHPPSTSFDAAEAFSDTRSSGTWNISDFCQESQRSHHWEVEALVAIGGIARTQTRQLEKLQEAMANEVVEACA